MAALVAPFAKLADGPRDTAMEALASSIDSGCESCHLVYWYPKQTIPKRPK